MKTFFKLLLNKISCNHSYEIIFDKECDKDFKLLLVCKKCGKIKIVKL